MSDDSDEPDVEVVTRADLRDRGLLIGLGDSADEKARQEREGPGYPPPR